MLKNKPPDLLTDCALLRLDAEVRNKQQELLKQLHATPAGQHGGTTTFRHAEAGWQEAHQFHRA